MKQGEFPGSKNFQRIIGCLLLLALFAVLCAPTQALEIYAIQEDVKGKVDPAAEDAAKEYLYALARGDKETLLKLTPKELERFYGPSLFKEIPKLTNPRAKGHRGLIDFEGEPTDPSLPSQGTISLTLRDSRDVDAWQVRGIFWKSDASLSLNPFSYSPTEKDRAQEREIRSCARKYLRAWHYKDWEEMDYMTYDWVGRKKKMRGSFYIRSIDLDSALRPDGSVRVEFRASVSPRVPVLGLIRRTAEGFLYVIKEDGEWKVRRMTAAL